MPSLWRHKPRTQLNPQQTRTFATGSKTAVILGVALIPLVFLLPALLRKRSLLAWAALVPILVAASQIAPRIWESIEGADKAVGEREVLFAAAREYFAREPILGLGFGGWFDNWSAVTGFFGPFRATLPPHNFLIAEWANAGIIVALLVALIMLNLVFAYFRLIRQAPSVRLALGASAQACAVLWIIGHGLYDNTYFYGVPNLIPIFAVLVVQTFKPNTDETGKRDRVRTPAVAALS